MTNLSGMKSGQQRQARGGRKGAGSKAWSRAGPQRPWATTLPFPDLQSNMEKDVIRLHLHRVALRIEEIIAMMRSAFSLAHTKDLCSLQHARHYFRNGDITESKTQSLLSWKPLLRTTKQVMGSGGGNYSETSYDLCGQGRAGFSKKSNDSA